MSQLEGRFAARQIPGGREYQEDDFGLIERGDADTDDGEVLLLADGMGGHVSGDTASSLVVKTFVETYPRTDGPVTDRLRACLTAANDALAEAVDDSPELKGMGSTLVATVVSTDGLDWISVGDSPLWLFREGRLRRLNADHSMAPVLASLVATGRMTEEQAATDSNRHVLRSALIGDEIHLVDTSSQPVAVRKSDLVILASDGLMTLEEVEIARIVCDTRNGSLDDLAGALIHAVEEAGHPYQDNTTVLLYAPEADCSVETIPEDSCEEEANADEETPASQPKRGLSGLWSGIREMLSGPSEDESGTRPNPGADDNEDDPPKPKDSPPKPGSNTDSQD